ncbi:unnamed protein product, partial [Trichogramma brassicae]
LADCELEIRLPIKLENFAKITCSENQLFELSIACILKLVNMSANCIDCDKVSIKTCNSRNNK